ncbi:MAG: CinA family protein [Treponema sp.]|jgi:PncC family amidohydrolase|nr:CinA family protein [Treponema sp.]
MSDCDLALTGDLAIHAGKAAEALIHKLKALSLTLALSESCTAGLISALLAGIPGASAVLWGSYVCYTYEAKVSMLSLDNEELLAHGLVSRETVSSMAVMTLKKSGACLAAAVTGIAGPDGDGSKVPVGTIWAAAVKRDGEVSANEFHFTGSRNLIRLRAAVAVLDLIQSVLDA